MNSEKRTQAKSLYFQTDLSKTQIADLLKVSRRSLHYWIKENNWDRLKKSATVLPAMLAENCYMIIAHFTQSLLSESRIMRPVTQQEADTLHKLTLTVRKLKNHSTLNESMEMFAHFMDRISKRSPELAEQVSPFVEEYVGEFARISISQLKPGNLNDMGFIPIEQQDATEAQKDLEDTIAWDDERDQPRQMDLSGYVAPIQNGQPAAAAEPVTAVHSHTTARRIPLTPDDTAAETITSYFKNLSDEEIAHRKMLIDEGERLLGILRQNQP